MNDLQFASVSLPGARASTGWWGEQTSPGEQGFGQSLVFMSRTNAEPQNLVIAPWLQQLSVKRTFGSRDRFALLPDVNVVVTCSYAQISNSATDFVRWARTNIPSSTNSEQPMQLSIYYDAWSESEMRDHNRVRPRRSFNLVLDLNFRGRPKALAINDLE